MKRAIRWIELIVQMVTVVLSIFTIVEVVKAWAYKRKMAQKAQEYLEDEFIEDANIGTSINVYSPKIKENNNRIMTFLAATGVGCVILVILSILKGGRD